jgi:sucrose 6(F)-phosphate phosphorylase
MQKTVVRRLLGLIRFRNEYPAFDGTFSVEESLENQIYMKWEKDNFCCKLNINLETSKTVILYLDESKNLIEYCV